MPIHLDDLDVLPEAAGLRSALIVPCNMCPAVTVAVKEGKPFLQLFRSLLRSAPFERYIKALQDRLREHGVDTKVFRSPLYHHWFMCMWPSGRRKKLERQAKHFDAVIVLGCDTATETVREAVELTGCRVIEGMKVAGLMNAKLTFRLPASVSFAECRIIPMPQREQQHGLRQAGAADGQAV